MNFNPSKLSDPQFFAEGRMAAHSDHRWFASDLEVRRGESSYEQSLDGTWKFHYAKNPDSVPGGFADPEFGVDEWDDIRVPAHIQMEGYDRPQYVNVQYPWDGHEQVSPPQVPTLFNPVACYVKDLELQRKQQKGERVTVTFSGAESALALWVNGTYVGYAEDSFTPSEFDLTPYLRLGTNRMAVQVFKWCAGSWLEDQDFFRFSGLFRSVTLRTYPAAHAFDLKVGVNLNEKLTEADVTVTVDLQGQGTARVRLDGVGELTEVAPGQFRATIENPQLWSAEVPHLYTGTVEVVDVEGNVVELIPLQVGVRRFGIEDGLLKINGERIVFMGVNRHEFGLNGRVMTREETEEDLIALKRINVNAIRTSHYPNNSFFYELADRYGFYVIDEMNLESHGVWDAIRTGTAAVEDAIPGSDPVWVPLLIDRATSMYERDKNHPSIVMWSSGNESFGGKDLLEVADYFRSVDSRPVHYEGIFWDERYPESSDVYSQMYTSAAEVERYLQENLDKPFILCEYAHTMGNSFGAVDRYVDLAYREARFQGGFIWDFADQAILMTDRYGNEYFGYGGDSGEAPHDGEFCGNGIFFADRVPTPRVQEVKYLYQGLRAEVTSGQVRVENRYNFLNSDAFACRVTLTQEGQILESATLETEVGPGETKAYPLPVSIPDLPGEYAIDVSFSLRFPTSYAHSGFEVASEQTVIEVEDSAQGPKHRPAPRLVLGIHNIGVHGPHFSAIFSRINGGLQSYRYGGRELLKAVPTPNFWHAPTSNERGWGGPFEDAQWMIASRYAKVEATAQNPKVETEGGLTVITYVYQLPTVPPSECTIRYTVDGDGYITVEQTLNPGRGLGDLPEFGMLFKSDADLSVLTWYGLGPDESYADKRGGARLGLYQQEVADQLVDYLRPQESGSHFGVRWAEVTDRKGWGLRFDADIPMEFSAQPWSPFEVENAAHPNELPPILNTYIRPALARRGVAGDDTWGARPHDEYLLPAGQLVFRFGFQGVL